jgi:hypothetical protein
MSLALGTDVLADFTKQNYETIQLVHETIRENSREQRRGGVVGPPTPGAPAPKILTLTPRDSVRYL